MFALSLLSTGHHQNGETDVHIFFEDYFYCLEKIDEYSQVTQAEKNWRTAIILKTARITFSFPNHRQDERMQTRAVP